MVYVVFQTVLTRLVFHHFMFGKLYDFLFSVQHKHFINYLKIGFSMELSFQKDTFLTFGLANQLVSFKLAIEEPAQSLIASKVDMHSGHKLISLGLKK